MRAGIIALLLFVACDGSSGSSTSTGSAAGSKCIDYTTCGEGLYCYVSSDAVEGVCDALPATCSGSTADCDCLRATLEAKCGSRGTCSARVGRAVYACTATVKKKEGETCSVARGCEKGLYCRVSTVTRSGTCEKLPAECAGGATCNCLGASGCAEGDSVRECSIAGDEASLVCE